RKERALDDGEPIPRLELPAARHAPPPAGGSGERSGAGLALAARPALERRVPPIVRELPAEIYDALVLGTRDYVRKNDFDTVVLGLSGGIDSALCACIACDAVGPRKVVGAGMPSQFTSAASREDAAALATALGLRFEELPIGEVLESYQRALAQVFAGAAPGITE